MSAGEAGQHVVGFLDFFIENSLEVQDKRYSQRLYLIDYVVPRLHFWLTNIDLQGNDPKPEKCRFTYKKPDVASGSLQPTRHSHNHGSPDVGFPDFTSHKADR